jgi:hypothetical protein
MAIAPSKPFPLELPSPLRATPHMEPKQIKLILDEEKSEHASLFQQNGFWPNVFAHCAKADKRHTAKSNTYPRRV